MNLNSIDSRIIPKFNYRDLMIFIVPVLIFILYLFVYNPGVLTVASYSQLHQIAAEKLTATYPVFYTYLLMLSLNITKSIAFMGVLQILVFSVIWTAICKYHRDDSIQGSNEFFLQFILTLIISLIPINAVYSITLSSNVMFSYSIMFLCFLIKVIIDKKAIDLKFSILLATTLAVVTGLNNYGILIALASLIVIIYYLLKQNTSQDKLVTLIGLSVVCILLIGSLNLTYDVKGIDYDEYTQTLNIPENDAFDDGIDLESAKNEFFSSTNYEPEDSYEETVSQNAGNFQYSIIDSFVNMFRNNFILGGLFNNPTVYLILSIILLVFINMILPSEETYLIYIPPFFNVLISIFTGQNNFYSILLVFYLIVIIFISIWFTFDLTPQNFSSMTKKIAKQEKIETQPLARLNKVKNLPKQKQEKIKTPIITRQEKTEPQPAVKQDYSEDTYYSTLESELEELTLDDINEMLGQSSTEETPKAEQSSEEGPDLIDEILKEMGKK